ncbi:MAG: SLC13 family permease [Elusimicrobiota bacterium]|nr:SLC13 family permease [Endomicrobiia bacterium]MDW8165448.1 SLC13 family permease [Elusimicrobiota bacterium]
MDNLIILIFILTYISFVIVPSKRLYVSVGSALLLTFLCLVGFQKSPLYGIDINVLSIIIGTLLISNLIVESGIAEYIAEKIITKTKNIKWTILVLCITTGLISMFLENVATLIIVSPIALEISKKLNINPTKIIFSLAISSNLQGTATLIGDPPSLLLAAATGMNFLDFFFYKGKPSIFFAVELGAISSFIVLYFIFRKEKQNDFKTLSTSKVKSWIPFYILCFKIFSLIVVSILTSHNKEGVFLTFAGIICLICGIFALLVKKFVLKTTISEGLKKLDWETILFLIGIFILVESIEISGTIEKFCDFLLKTIGTNKFIIYTVFVFSAVLISGFVDNVPFFLTMIPVAKIISSELGISLELLLFGLLIGTTLGGNITPTGASANIVGWGIVKKEGYNPSFIDFVKIGLPFTIAAVLPTYLFIWFVWK